MPTKKLRATFATDRVDFINTLATSGSTKAGDPFSRLAITPRLTSTGPLVEAEGPAQDVMHLIGAVAAQGEDFLLMVTPC